MAPFFILKSIIRFYNSMITRSTLRSNRFKSYNHFNKQGDYANIRPSKVKPAPEGDWDDDLDPEDRARLMGRDFMGPKWK